MTNCFLPLVEKKKFQSYVNIIMNLNRKKNVDGHNSMLTEPLNFLIFLKWEKQKKNTHTHIEHK